MVCCCCYCVGVAAAAAAAAERAVGGGSFGIAGNEEVDIAVDAAEGVVRCFCSWTVAGTVAAATAAAAAAGHPILIGEGCDTV